MNSNSNSNCSHVCISLCTTNRTEQFWLFSLLISTQSPKLQCCLLEGRGPQTQSKGNERMIGIDCHLQSNVSGTWCLLGEWLTFWQFSFISSRLSSLLICCLEEAVDHGYTKDVTELPCSLLITQKRTHFCMQLTRKCIDLRHVRNTNLHTVSK